MEEEGGGWMNCKIVQHFFFFLTQSVSSTSKSFKVQKKYTWLSVLDFNMKRERGGDR